MSRTFFFVAFATFVAQLLSVWPQAANVRSVLHRELDNLRLAAAWIFTFFKRNDRYVLPPGSRVRPAPSQPTLFDNRTTLASG